MQCVRLVSSKCPKINRGLWLSPIRTIIGPTCVQSPYISATFIDSLEMSSVGVSRTVHTHQDGLAKRLGALDRIGSGGKGESLTR